MQERDTQVYSFQILSFLQGIILFESSSTYSKNITFQNATITEKMDIKVEGLIQEEYKRHESVFSFLFFSLALLY